MERTCIGGCECVSRLAVLGCHPALCDSSRRAGNFEHNSQNPRSFYSDLLLNARNDRNPQARLREHISIGYIAELYAPVARTVIRR